MGYTCLEPHLPQNLEPTRSCAAHAVQKAPAAAAGAGAGAGAVGADIVSPALAQAASRGSTNDDAAAASDSGARSAATRGASSRHR